MWNGKRLFALLLALLLLGCVALAEDGAKTDVTNPVAAYEGVWVSGRARLTIEELDDVIRCAVSWGGSAFETAEWEYEASYDEVADGLTTLEKGVKRVVTYAESGEVVSSVEEYNDGAANFALNDDGTLTWTDFKETPGENALVFERLPAEE